MTFRLILVMVCLVFGTGCVSGVFARRYIRGYVELTAGSHADGMAAGTMLVTRHGEIYIVMGGSGKLYAQDTEGREVPVEKIKEISRVVTRGNDEYEKIRREYLRKLIRTPSSRGPFLFRAFGLELYEIINT